MGRRPAPADHLLLTCEHGGHRIPRAYASLFRGAGAVLASHRGWDRGALDLARFLARRLDAPLHATTWSRLLVEANRSPHNPRIWSACTASLPRAERQRILERWWLPHRQAVERDVAQAVARGLRVVHVAVHTFTPVLDGVARTADVAFLYDSRRRTERAWCDRWANHLARLAPDLRLRRNYPYLGLADGLTTALRKRHPAMRYLGIELEVNQALVVGPGWRRLRDVLACSLRDALAGV